VLTSNGGADGINRSQARSQREEKRSGSPINRNEAKARLAASASRKAMETNMAALNARAHHLAEARRSVNVGEATASRRPSGAPVNGSHRRGGPERGELIKAWV